MDPVRRRGRHRGREAGPVLGGARQEDEGVRERDMLAQFEQAVMPHLGSAYNLARWLTRNDHDAEDLVQEAYLRAFKFFGGFEGTDARAWLLAVVRNACYTFLKKRQDRGPAVPFDEELHSRRSIERCAVSNSSAKRWTHKKHSISKAQSPACCPERCSASRWQTIMLFSRISPGKCANVLFALPSEIE